MEKKKSSERKKSGNNNSNHMKSYVDNLIDSGQIEVQDVKVKKGLSNMNVTSQGTLLKKSIFTEPGKLIFTNNQHRDDAMNQLTGSRSVIDYQQVGDDTSANGGAARKRKDVRRRQISQHRSQHHKNRLAEIRHEKVKQIFQSDLYRENFQNSRTNSIDQLNPHQTTTQREKMQSIIKTQESDDGDIYCTKNTV